MWVRLDDRFTTHPKILRCSVRARWLFLECLCYCAGQLTDGRVPAQLLRGHRKELSELLHVDLLHKDGEDFVVHDWAVYNGTREQWHQKRAADAERKRRQRDRERDSAQESRRDH